jgi:hypothetical protein
MTQKKARWKRDWAAWYISRMPGGAVQDAFELWFGIACLISGPTYALGIIHHGSLEELLPWALVRLWGIALTIGGACVVPGIIWRQVYIERAGLWPLMAASWVYAIGLWRYGTLAGVPVGILTFLLGVACGHRLLYVGASLTLQHYVRRVRDHHDL